ncbi:MAG TPA: FAD binding domain-containing protein, partial [Novosphingobium sp.]|nr:FAD binding domain-containing protein [Novosphingobium sp.]
MSVALVLDGRAVTIEQAGPTDSLLDWLRLRMGRTGTKEGCAEGDCGACTVLVGTLEDDGLVWRAVNACIQFLPMLHGKAVMTVESLGGPRAPTALQVAMAGNGASQCGFCTPGFVMSLHGRCMGARGADLPLADALAGNLCRCTGYGPILAAGEAAAPVQRDDSGLVAQLRGIAGGLMPQGAGPGGQWFAPRTVQELADLLARHPQARIVAGATDVGLWITKALRDLPVAIFIGDIAELATIAEDADGLTLGACVRYADAHAPLARLHPDMGELVRRIAGLQVRNAATIGGNIAN